MAIDSQFRYRPLTALVTGISILMGTYGLLGIVAAYSDWLEIQMLQEAQAGEPVIEERVETNDARQGMIGIGQTVILVALAVVFLFWVNRSNKNARALGAVGMVYTPGWSVGWYFVPIMNLFKPYQAMKEIWQASHPDFGDDWRHAPASPLLPLWWGSWLVCTVLSRAAFRLSMKADEVTELLTASQVQLVSDLLDFPLAIVTFTLVYRVHRMQEDKNARAQENLD